MTEITRSQKALITGSSSGMRLHLAKEFARQGHLLVLVAPAADEPEAVAKAIWQKDCG